MCEGVDKGSMNVKTYSSQNSRKDKCQDNDLNHARWEAFALMLSCSTIFTMGVFWDNRYKVHTTSGG